MMGNLLSWAEEAESPFSFWGCIKSSGQDTILGSGLALVRRLANVAACWPQEKCERLLAEAAAGAAQMEAECAALSVRAPTSSTACLAPHGQQACRRRVAAWSICCRDSPRRAMPMRALALTVPVWSSPCNMLMFTFAPQCSFQSQAANRQEAANLAAQQQEVAALEAESRQLSMSRHAQTEHDGRFRSAVERCALLKHAV